MERSITQSNTINVLLSSAELIEAVAVVADRKSLNVWVPNWTPAMAGGILMHSVWEQLHETRTFYNHQCKVAVNTKINERKRFKCSSFNLFHFSVYVLTSLLVCEQRVKQQVEKRGGGRSCLCFRHTTTTLNHTRMVGITFIRNQPLNGCVWFDLIWFKFISNM